MPIKRLFLISMLLTGLDLIPTGLTAQSFTVLHSFNGSDGGNPHGSLVLSGDYLYGTTEGGGSSGAGTVFKINVNGTQFSNLYSFTATSGPMGTNSDGRRPSAGLLLSDNTLYGTTDEGGPSGYGTVFALDMDGSDFRTLHNFNELVYQVSGLILAGDTLYGTTDLGGTSSTGSIFKLNTNGTDFITLYSFPQGTPNAEGAYPLAALTLLGSTLYGTAAGGGSRRGGTVFRLNTDGTGFTNLHNFYDDAYDPNAGLILSGDTLYGVTITGDTLGGTIATPGAGAVFKLNTNGFNFTNLYYFTLGDDGGYPAATLSLFGNTLFGSAGLGGNSGNGVIFKINTDGGGFTVLHQFSPRTSGTNIDGATPWTSVVPSGNVLYGTTSNGGSSGNGTLFKIFVLPELAINLVGNDVILSWQTNYAGFNLQSTTNFVSPVWVTNSPSPIVINGQNTVTNAISGTKRFYRLSQ